MRTDLYLFAEPTIRFCEDNIGGLIEQPANSLSSLIISLFGVIILMRKQRHTYTTWLGWTAILVGLTSFAYHASYTFVGQLGDLGSLYLLAAFLFVAAIRTKEASKAVAILVLGTCIPLALTAIFKTIGQFNIGIPLFAIMLLLAIGLEIRTTLREKRSLSFFGWGILLLVLGQIVWWLDFKQVWCSPATFHFINGHSLWHVVAGLAMLCLDQHYRRKK